MKWLMRLIASVIISLMGGIPLLRRAGTFPVLLLCGTLYLESLSLRWQKAAGRIAERIRG